MSNAMKLDMPGTVRLTSSGLEFTGALDFDGWLEAVGKLFSINKFSWWWIGDALAWGEQQYGEKYAQAEALSEASGMHVDSIRAAQWVSEKIAPVHRRTNLSWSHHRAVAALDAEEQDRLLGLSDENDWSVSKLREVIKSYQKALADPDAGDDEPKPGTEIDPEYGDAEDVEPDIDPVKEWERAEAENERLREQIESLTADDKTAEIAKLHERVAGLEGRLRQEMTRANEAVSTVKYYQRQFADLREALGVEKNAEVKARVLELLQGVPA